LGGGIGVGNPDTVAPAIVTVVMRTPGRASAIHCVSNIDAWESPKAKRFTPNS